MSDVFRQKGKKPLNDLKMQKEKGLKEMQKRSKTSGRTFTH